MASEFAVGEKAYTLTKKDSWWFIGFESQLAAGNSVHLCSWLPGCERVAVEGLADPHLAGREGLAWCSALWHSTSDPGPVPKPPALTLRDWRPLGFTETMKEACG